MEERIANFLLFLASFERTFIEINNEGAFCHLWRNFQRNSRVNGFEVAFEASRIVNMLRRNLIASIWPHEENQASWRFNMRSVKYSFKIRFSGSCSSLILRLYYFHACVNTTLSLVNFTTFVTISFDFTMERKAGFIFCFGAKKLNSN